MNASQFLKNLQVLKFQGGFITIYTDIHNMLISRPVSFGIFSKKSINIQSVKQRKVNKT